MPKKPNPSGLPRWQERLVTAAQRLDLPEDTWVDLPRVYLYGKHHVLIENHRGVLEVAPDRLRVAVTGGEIIVEAAHLIVRYILPDEILADGEISKVIYQ
ncbi:MAG: sporulation protein YqfC [Firmicutes bacterium]|nr:sporulation protein YqfC [Bacillota bacterium]